MLELFFLWAYGGWNIFDIFFVQYCSMCYYVLVSVGWRSHTLRVTAIYCFWLFQANSLGHIFIIFYLCNVLLLLYFLLFLAKCVNK